MQARVFVERHPARLGFEVFADLEFAHHQRRFDFSEVRRQIAIRRAHAHHRVAFEFGGFAGLRVELVRLPIVRIVSKKSVGGLTMPLAVRCLGTIRAYFERVACACRSSAARTVSEARFVGFEPQPFEFVFFFELAQRIGDARRDERPSRRLRTAADLGVGAEVRDDVRGIVAGNQAHVPCLSCGHAWSTRRFRRITADSM